MTEDSMKRETGVKLRGGTYQFEIKAPADLKRAGLYRGPWAFRTSLNTQDRQAANLKGAQLRAEWLRRFDQQRLALKEGKPPSEVETTLAAQALAGIKAALVEHMRQELARIDTRTGGLAASEREQWALALDAEHEHAQHALEVQERPEPEALALLADAAKRAGVSLADLTPQAVRACEMEAQSCRCELLILLGEAVEDVSRTFPERVSRMARRSAAVDLAALPALAPPAPSLSVAGGFDPVALRQLKGLDIEKGKWTLRELFAAFYEARRSEWKDWQSRIKRDYGPVEVEAVSILGAIRVEALNLSHIGRVADHLSKQAKAKGLAVGTLDKHFNRLAAVLRWAHTQRILDDLTPPLTGLTVERDSYEAFTPEELKALFECEAYRTNAFPRASGFWLPLLGLYSGARVNELASVRLEDIGPDKDHPEVVGIMLAAEAGAGKNKYAHRFIPIHPALIECGFFRYVETLRSEGQTELFPDTATAARDGKGKTGTRDFVDHRRSVGVGAQAGKGTKTFHSFRSTLVTAMKKAGVSGEIRREIVGHSGKDVHERTYEQGAIPARAKLEALKRVRFDFRHPTWTDSPTHRQARAKALKAPAKA